MAIERGTCTILVVDDDTLLREMAAAMLDALGYGVACAVNGQEGVEYYGAHKDEVDLVLLDMKMPVMDGRECFRRLRQIDSEAKVILSTGSACKGAVQQILGEGALSLLPKPYGMTQLAEALERALRKRPSVAASATRPGNVSAARREDVELGDWPEDQGAAGGAGHQED